MGSLSNTLEGSSGTTISNANSAGPDQFNTVTITGAGTTLTYDTAHVHGGSTSAKAALASGVSSTTYLQWSSLPNTPTANAYIRFYAYLTALPPVSTVLCKFLDGASVETTLQLQTTGFLRTLTAAGGQIAAMTESFPVNQWVRVEYEVTGISGTSGTVAARIFSGANLETTTPDSGGSLSNSSASLTGTVTQVRVGTSSAVSETGGFTYWLDDVAYSDVATPGPSVTSSPIPVVIAAVARPAAPAGSGAPQVITAPAAGIFAGTATLSGSGTLTAAPYFDPSPVTLSGSGSLTAAPVLAGAAALSGAGTLTASPVFAGGATLSGQGTLTAAATAPAGAVLSGQGTLTAAPFFAETASLSGSGTLTGTPAFTAAATLSGAGTLSATPVFAATASLSGTGTLTGSPQIIGPVPSALLTVQQPRPPPPAPRPQILPPVQQDFLVVVADMQPAQHTTAPPTVVAAQIAGLNPQPKYVLIAGDCTNDGDNTGFTGEFTNFDSMYGGIKAILRPAPGNHDWGNVVGQGNLTAYDTYWGSQAHSGATPPHFYSFDTPTGWHVIAIDSDEQWVGSLNNPSSTYSAVAADLAANTGKPIIAFWHHPRFSDGTNTTDPGGTGDTTTVQDIWNLLRDYACDLVFVGHCHSYQRFPKFGKTGTADALGIREFVVGTGGSGLFTLTGAPGSPARSDVNSWQSGAYDQLNSEWFGFLKLYLTPSTYSWQFVSQNAAGSQNPGAVLDSGGPVPTNLSQGAPQGAPGANLSGSGTLTASPAFAATAALSGSGTLTASPVLTGTAVMSGTGTLGAAPAFAGTAVLSGSGALTAGPVLAGAAALSGTGTLTASPVLAGTATLSGTGTLTATPAFTPAAALSGSGTLSAAAPGVAGIPVIRPVAQPPAPAPPPPPRITGFTPPAVFAGAATLSGTGTLSGAVQVGTGAALSGSGSLTAAPVLTGTASLSGAGTLTASPALAGAATLAGTGTLGAAPVLGAAAGLSGTGSLTTAPGLAPIAALSGSGTLTGHWVAIGQVFPGTVIAADRAAFTVAAADRAAMAMGAADWPAQTVEAADRAAGTVQAADRPAGTVTAADRE